VRISNFPGGVPGLGVTARDSRDMVAQQEGFQTILTEHPHVLHDSKPAAAGDLAR
jgi:hypothetical protein